MRIINGLKNLPSFSKNSVVAIGNFDGIHLGHQKILRFLINESKKFGFLSFVLTFSPHPEKILGKSQIKMIQTLEQRLEEIEKFDIQDVLVLTFDLEFANLSSQDFIRNIIIKALNAKEIIVGENFRFGKNREGDLYTLYRLASISNLKVHSIASVTEKGIIVSSSLIRSSLMRGEIDNANAMLGRPYEIEGTVIKGKSRGKDLGFPTANIQTKNEIIPQGVFVSCVTIDNKTFPSLTNIGNCPTFDQQDTNIESYIINFEADLYGKNLRIYFKKKIRSEIQFKTPEELKSQIEKDLNIAKIYFDIE